MSDDKTFLLQCSNSGQTSFVISQVNHTVLSVHWSQDEGPLLSELATTAPRKWKLNIKYKTNNHAILLHDFTYNLYKAWSYDIIWLQSTALMLRAVINLLYQNSSMQSLHTMADTMSKPRGTPRDCSDLESESWVDATRLDREHMTAVLLEVKEPSLDSSVFPSCLTSFYKVIQSQVTTLDTSVHLYELNWRYPTTNDIPQP